METNLMTIIGVAALIILLIIVLIIVIIFRRKKPKQLSPQDQRIENEKKFKIKCLLNDGINAMMDRDYKRATYNFEFAKSTYNSFKNRDLRIEQGLTELYAMLPKQKA